MMSTSPSPETTRIEVTPAAPAAAPAPADLKLDTPLTPAVVPAKEPKEKKTKSEAPAKAAGEPPKTDAPASTPEPVVSKVIDKSVMDTLSAEFAEKGDITPETLASVSDRVDPEVVKHVVQVMKTNADSTNTLVKDAWGGEEKFNTVADWARTNLPEADRNAFDKAYTSGNPAAAYQAAKAVMDKYIAANGNADRVSPVTGKAAPTVSGYNDRSEMIRDMQDPRYRDPQARWFQEQVAAKVAASRPDLLSVNASFR